MRLFDWSSVKNLNKLLLHPDLDDAKNKVASFIVESLEDERYVKSFYRYDKEWLKNFNKSDDKIKEVIEIGFNKLIGVEDPECYNPFEGRWRKELLKRGNGIKDKDVQLYYHLIRDFLEHESISKKYDREDELGHYFLDHTCDIIVVFAYDLCQLVFPKKKFMIAKSSDHVFVVEEGNEEMMYDINWYIGGVPRHTIEEQKIEKVYDKDKYIKEFVCYI